MKKHLILLPVFLFAVVPVFAAKDNSEKSHEPKRVSVLDISVTPVENCETEGLKNHGAYVSCVSQQHPGGKVVSEAARSDIGKKTHQDDDDDNNSTPSVTPSTSPTVSPSVSPTGTPTPSVTPSVEPTPSISPSVEPTPSATSTALQADVFNPEYENVFAKIVSKLINFLPNLI